MRMGVSDLLVSMPVGVSSRGHEPLMWVVVVTVIVTVAMDVTNVHVDVGMRVPVDRHQRDGNNEEGTGEELCALNRLPEHNPGERRTDKGRGSEHRLGSDGALLMSSGDV